MSQIHRLGCIFRRPGGGPEGSGWKDVCDVLLLLKDHPERSQTTISGPLTLLYQNRAGSDQIFEGFTC